MLIVHQGMGHDHWAMAYVDIGGLNYKEINYIFLREVYKNKKNYIGYIEAVTCN